MKSRRADAAVFIVRDSLHGLIRSSRSGTYALMLINQSGGRDVRGTSVGKTRNRAAQI
jgi:hypothetical protein